MTCDYNDLMVQVGDNIMIFHLQSKSDKSINSTFIIRTCSNNNQRVQGC